MDDKMVEIARFQYPAEAQTLIALLKSEGIDCYIRNELSTQVMGGYVDMGGVRVELLESEAPHALEVMVANGYEIPDENEEPEQIKTVVGWARHIPFLRNLSLEKQILFLFIIIAVCIGLLIFFGSLLSSHK
ncbi:MAG: DUF2007 domain-containing protein [Tannerellaceae bacterium]|jgi:hypothetical protein|nr:DUF2007 domain-containing protein [Tannerellaceae bacterium]